MRAALAVATVSLVCQLGESNLRAALLALILLLGPPSGARAEEGPQPPCGTAPYPSFPEADAPPNARLWSRKDLPADWPPPACAGWPAGGFKIVVALAGAFPSGGGVEDLLGRFGAVSETRGVRYWSATDDAWRVLVEDAAALSAPDPTARRADFTAAEMRSGEDLYFLETDNRSTNPVVYRMRVRTITPDRLAITVENVSAVRFYLLTLFEPGELQSTTFLERLAPGVWGYYSLGGVAEGASFLSSGHPSSYVNRAVAAFRHVAGVPTDRDPPYAP